MSNLKNLKPEKILVEKSWFALMAILVAGTLLRVPQIGEHLELPYIFRRSHTAVVAREFLESEKGIFGAGFGPLPVFGPDSQIPFEFPLFQFLAASISNLGVPIEIAGRSLGLFFFQASALLVFLFVRKKLGVHSAYVVLALSQLSPWGLIWSTAFLIEFMASFFGLLMVITGERALERKDNALIWLFFAMLSGAIVSLVKVTTAAVFLVLLGLLFMSRIAKGTFPKRDFLIFFSISATSVTVGAWWVALADKIKGSQPAVANLTSGSLTEWNFGTVGQRLNIEVLSRMLDHLWPLVLGPLAIFLVIFILAWKIKVPRIIWILIVTSLSGPALFTNLYFVHSYYLSAVFFPLIIVLGWMLSAVASHAKSQAETWKPMSVILLLLLSNSVLVLSENDFRKDLFALYRPVDQEPLSLDLKSFADLDSTIYLVNCDWSPRITYETGLPVNMWRWERPKDSEGVARISTELDMESGDLVGSCQSLFNKTNSDTERLIILTERLAMVTDT